MKKILMLTAGFILTGGMFLLSAAPPDPQLPDGAAILEARCTACHDRDRFERAGHDPEQWKATVKRMAGKARFGPPLSDVELQALLEHLTTL